MTPTVHGQLTTEQTHTRAGVLAGMLLYQYIGDPTLIVAVADHLVHGWLAAQHSGDPRSLDQLWDDYIAEVESAVGGADHASDDDLTKLWHAHARRLARNLGGAAWRQWEDVAEVFSGSADTDWAADRRLLDSSPHAGKG